MERASLTSASDRLFQVLTQDFENKINPRRLTLSDLKIRTKERELITFHPNAPQQILLDELCPNWREGDFSIRGRREMILKARQQGFSTLIAGLFFLDTINNPRTYSVVIANDQQTTDKLFDIIRRFYDNLAPEKKPHAKYASRTEFYWPELDSKFYVGTAGSRQFGRGTTVNNVHGSEVAFWEDASSIVSGLLEATPEGGNVFLESTANGMGNYFHQTWIDEETNLGKKFFAWFHHPDYKKTPPPDFAKTEEEVELAKVMQLTDSQLQWRREKKNTPGLIFKQEYPATPQEAFVASGNSYFDLEILDTYALHVVEGSCPFPHHKRVYKEFVAPQEGRRYVINGDVAEGLNDEGDHDYCTIQVLDMDSWEQVAVYRERVEPVDFAKVCCEIGFRYNTGLLVIERNNHGHAVLLELIHHTDYPRMKRDVWGGIYYHLDYDASRKARTKKPGFPTTVKSKAMALDALQEMILEKSITINDKATIEELQAFQKLPGGKFGAMAGYHDDLVMALAIGAYMLKDAPKTKPRGKPKRLAGQLL